VTEHDVGDFRPSVDGFRFANRFPHGPTVKFGPLDPRWIGVGDAADGLCGGMVLTVRDLYQAGVKPPPDTEPPANGSPRFRSIVRRQVQSLDWLKVPARYYFESAVGGSVGMDRARRTYETEWPKIRAEIDAGRLAITGLIRVASPNPFRLTSNHQVIVWGYAEDGRGVSLRLYDPNWPSRDDVTATIHLDPAFRPIGLFQSTGEPLLGLFLQPYVFANPVAWR
jgi:hypothetical protein